ncbi:MAG TPA: hypothetical protein VGL07_17970 [Buttiauxella sp.]|jgi:hypothetical protein
MRRQVQVMQPVKGELVAGVYRQGHEKPFPAMLSMQPANGGGTFKEYLTGRKVSDYMEAIGEVDLKATEEGEHNGAQVICGGKTYEVVDRLEWLNGVINHYEYLLYCTSTQKEKVSG